MLDWRKLGIRYRADVVRGQERRLITVVTKVYNDDMMGFTVIILHSDGFETIYFQLQQAACGGNQEVKLGDVIGRRHDCGMRNKRTAAFAF